MTTKSVGRVIPDFAKLYETGHYSDPVVVCDGRRWSLHRAIVSLSSESFAAARDDIGSVSLDEYAPQLVDLMVRYLYTFSYADDNVRIEISEDGHSVFSTLGDTDAPSMDAYSIASEDDDMVHIAQPKSLEQTHSCLLVNVYIYAMANNLKIPELRTLAVQKFIERLTDDGEWPHHKFSEVVATILENTSEGDSGLRPIILELLVQHASQILHYQVCEGYKIREDRETWMNVLRRDGGFMVAVWNKTIANKSESH